MKGSCPKQGDLPRIGNGPEPPISRGFVKQALVRKVVTRIEASRSITRRLNVDREAKRVSDGTEAELLQERPAA